MSEEFGSMMGMGGGSRKSKKDWKAEVESSDFAIGGVFSFLFWATVKQPGKTLLGIFGAIGVFSSIGPFMMGIVGLGVADNAPLTQKMANGASLGIVRPVVNGFAYAVTANSLQEQNKLANPKSNGTLTTQQVKALSGYTSTKIMYVTNKQ
jgi:hypothetical protein